MSAKLWAVRRNMKLLNLQGCSFPCSRGNEKERTLIVELPGMGFWTRVRFPPAPLDREVTNTFAVCYNWKHSSAGRALAWLAGGHGFEPRCFHRSFWGISAAGSAPHSHCGGHGFESRILHYISPVFMRVFNFRVEWIFWKPALIFCYLACRR